MPYENSREILEIFRGLPKYSRKIQEISPNRRKSLENSKNFLENSRKIWKTFEKLKMSHNLPFHDSVLEDSREILTNFRTLLEYTREI